MFNLQEIQSALETLERITGKTCKRGHSKALYWDSSGHCKICRKIYRNTERGIAANERYAKSEKGIEANKRYRKSDKSKLRYRRYNNSIKGIHRNLYLDMKNKKEKIQRLESELKGLLND